MDFESYSPINPTNLYYPSLTQPTQIQPEF